MSGTENENTENVDEAAEPLARDSGPVEGASGEPGSSPDDEAAVAAEETSAEASTADAGSPDQAAQAAEAEAPAAEPTADVPADASEEAPATETGGAEAPAEEPATQPGVKQKRKRLPRAQRRQRPKPKRERPAERKPITREPKPVSERGRRQERRGVVVSNAMDKTIVVKVDTIKAHTKYKKVVRHSVKFHAHDPQNQANVGDVVRIVETRPLSKTKNWRLVEVVEAAR